MGNKWQKLIDFSNIGLNSGIDGADIGDNECQKALDVVFDNGAMEKAPGRTIVGNSPGAYPVGGVHRAWDKSGNKTLLKAVNGILYRWTGTEWTSVQDGLTPAVKCDFFDADDKTLIVNGYDEALEFDPSNNSIQKLGLHSPRYFDKIAYFEDNEESLWSLGTGAAFSNVVYSIEERTGNTKQSLYLISPAATTRTCTMTYASAQDFSKFQTDAPTILISNDDYFCASILHRTRSYIDTIFFDFITSTGNYYRLTVNGSELDPDAGRDNVWTNIIGKKARFVATGSPDWSNITKFAISVTGITGSAEIFVDDCYWKNSPIEATIYRKAIDNFEGALSAWTVTNGTLSDNITNFVEGTKSLVVTRSNTPTTLYKNVSLDLSKFIDQAPVQTSDEISIQAYVPASANLTSITLKLYSGGGTGNYFYCTFTTAGGDIKGSASGLWNNLRKAVSDFTSSGSPSWSTITRIEISFVSSGSLSLNFDAWALEEALLTQSLATMETSEAWTFSGGKGGFDSSSNHRIEGSSSIYCNPKESSPSVATLILGTPVDLSNFSGGGVSGTKDYISFWVSSENFSTVASVKLEIDCNLGDFSTDYFSYELFPEDIEALPNIEWPGSQIWRGLIRIAKENFERIGQTGGKGWDTVKAYRFTVSKNGTAGILIAYFDDLSMIRRSGLNGIYQWACVFVRSDGTKSGISEWSEQVLFSGTKAVLTLLPISMDLNVSERRFYRKGGTLGDASRLDFSIYDNTTVVYYTSLSDELLGENLDFTDIPGGTIRVPFGGKWGPQYKGEYILYRDPSNLRRVYYSLADRKYGWSELQARDFNSDVLDVFVIDDILFFNTKNGIKSLSVPMSEAKPTDFHERGLVKHSMGPFASYPVESQRACVSYDGVYLFDGNSFQYLSDQVKDKFDSTVYNISEAIVFYRKRHIYISVSTIGGTRNLLDYDIDSKAWRISDYIVNCFCVAQGIGDNDEIYVGDNAGNVYQFDIGYASSFEFISKDYAVDPENKFAEAVLNEIFVMAKSNSLTPGCINIQFRTNQQLQAGIVKSFPSSGNLLSTYKLYHHQLQSVSNYIKGNKIGVAITPGTLGKHFAIEAILLVGEVSPLPEAYEEDNVVGADLITFLGRLSADPSTSDWGTTDAGRYVWFNTVDSHWKGWSGTEIVIIG